MAHRAVEAPQREVVPWDPRRLPALAYRCLCGQNQGPSVPFLNGRGNLSLVPLVLLVIRGGQRIIVEIPAQGVQSRVRVGLHLPDGFKQ